MARRDPRDTAKAPLPAVQCHAVNGGPLAPAPQSQVDASPGQAEGRRDLGESSTAPGGRGRHEWTASLTLGRAGWRNGGRAYGTRARGPRSFHGSQRTGKPSTRAERSQRSPPAKGSRCPAGQDVKGRERRRADTLLTSIQAWGKRQATVKDLGNWRAGCGESRTFGSEGGREKRRLSRPRSRPTLPRPSLWPLGAAHCQR